MSTPGPALRGDTHRPQVVVGSSRGGAVAMNINSGDAKLVLLCPAWRNWGTAKIVRPDTLILHSRADDVVPFADSEALVKNSGLLPSALIEVGSDHRLADPEPLAAMLSACDTVSTGEQRGRQDTHRAADSSACDGKKDSPCKAFPSTERGSIDSDVDFWRRAGKTISTDLLVRRAVLVYLSPLPAGITA